MAQTPPLLVPNYTQRAARSVILTAAVRTIWKLRSNLRAFSKHCGVDLGIDSCSASLWIGFYYDLGIVQKLAVKFFPKLLNFFTFQGVFDSRLYVFVSDVSIPPFIDQFDDPIPIMQAPNSG